MLGPVVLGGLDISLNSWSRSWWASRVHDEGLFLCHFTYSRKDNGRTNHIKAFSVALNNGRLLSAAGVPRHASSMPSG